MSKEKDQNINVFVRIKPLSKTNISEKCTTAVKMISDTEIMVCERSQDRFSRNFTFDRVFDPSSTQVDIYNTVMSPLLKEIIAGYNCTVFAYGQTNTGKTYTMEGDRLNDPNLHWQSDTSAGMIPRCLSHLFDELLSKNQNYIIKVNYLELYNEELFDLLSKNDDVSTSRLILYEDSKKGVLTIHGLEEVIVRDKYEAYEILRRNSERRQTATTLLNVNSSRSHTVFSITVQMKEISNSDELLKTAKLNLVDLAGTENISKSGAVDKRARESKNINQSLLALGRVITALVNKAPHIPYRESKLTRLLQESLGGRTKTSIIATVSFANSNIEETLSTLEYANRARNITNRPEINQKLCKKLLLKEYTKEIESLRKDLLATSTKNGICLSLNNYNELQMSMEYQSKKIQEINGTCKMLEGEIKNKEECIHNLQLQYDVQTNVLTKITNEVYDMNSALKLTKMYVKQIEDDKNKQKHLVEKYIGTKQILHAQMGSLLNVVKEASEDARKLQDKLDCKRQIEEKNKMLVWQTSDDLMERYTDIENILSTYKTISDIFFQKIRDKIETQIAAQIKNMKATIRSMIRDAIHQHFTISKNVKREINTSYACYRKMLNTYVQDTSRTMKNGTECLSDFHLNAASNMFDLLKYNESFLQQLQILKMNILQKVDSVSEYAKFVLEAVCEDHLEECNYLRKSLTEIREHINCIAQNKKQTMENYKEFGKEMENLLCKFRPLNEHDRNSKIIDASCQIDEICTNIYDHTQVYSVDMNKQKHLKNSLENISQAKSDIDHNFDQMHMMGTITIEKGNVLVNDLQKHLNTSCTTLKQYNNNVRFNLEQLQEKMEKDKIVKLNLNNTICETVKDLNLNHVTFMEQQQHKISNLCKKIDDELTIHDIETHNCNNDIIDKLHISQQQIDEFLVEDSHHYIPTGTTPPRKTFSYSHQFATTSPLLSWPSNKSFIDSEIAENIGQF
ncbi:kinesin-like protein Klp61F [Linepithema humile]|uniref:kinesin-like protein Klp61F n=1 Tax=Linepithema humile TaxID=83485 RepID=UPI0006236727|nr:PREDICTED: bipolar kinesin KRP-130-like [Linepithema humile]